MFVLLLLLLLPPLLLVLFLLLDAFLRRRLFDATLNFKLQRRQRRTEHRRRRSQSRLHAEREGEKRDTQKGRARDPQATKATRKQRTTKLLLLLLCAAVLTSCSSSASPALSRSRSRYPCHFAALFAPLLPLPSLFCCGPSPMRLTKAHEKRFSYEIHTHTQILGHSHTYALSCVS